MTSFLRKRRSHNASLVLLHPFPWWALHCISPVITVFSMWYKSQNSHQDNQHLKRETAALKLVLFSLQIAVFYKEMSHFNKGSYNMLSFRYSFRKLFVGLLKLKENESPKAIFPPIKLHQLNMDSLWFYCHRAKLVGIIMLWR